MPRKSFVFIKEGVVSTESRELDLKLVAVFSRGGGFRPVADYGSFSASSAIPIFDRRYRSALRDNPSNRAA
jgi:hypothetical protein